MATTISSPSGRRFRPGTGAPVRGWPTALHARLRGGALDRQLAAGAKPWRTPLHAQRSLQITGLDARFALARSLENVLERATLAPRRGVGISAAVPINRHAVLLARPELEAIATHLRSGEPVNTRGVAALRGLITDASSPLYGAEGETELTRIFAALRDSLHVPD